jgi:hypothetical protein
MLLAENYLDDRGDPASGVEQLRATGVPRAVGVHRHAHACADRFEPDVNEHGRERVVAEQRRDRDTLPPEALIEAAIRQSIELNVNSSSATGSFWGRVTINGQVIEYRAYPIGNNTINVGTYYDPNNK